MLVAAETARSNMNEWDNGYKVGYLAGYEAAISELNEKIKPVEIHDPGDIDELYEQAYGDALYKQMKKDHDKF